MTTPVKIGTVSLGSGIPKICVSITGSSKEEILIQAAEIKHYAPDLIELRADYFTDLHERGALSDLLTDLAHVLNRIPLIFTIRTEEEGGKVSLSGEEYAGLCLYAAKTHCISAMDVEVFSHTKEEQKKIDPLKKELIRQLREEEIPVIASTHDFEKTDSLEDLVKTLTLMDQTDADVLKMAVMPSSREDVFNLMLATNQMTACTQKPLITMSMGQDGSITRVAGESFGSSLTFAAVGETSAPGQLPISSLRPILEELHKK